MLIAGHCNAIICHSRAGLGKTYNTIKLLESNNAEYVYNSGVTTAVALYKMLYDDNGKIIVFDDVETIFKDERAINILKASLWGFDDRIVTYKTSSKVLDGYPDNFVFTGKIIILANDIYNHVNKSESLKALLSRCIVYELTYTIQELYENIKMIINEKNLTKEQKEHCLSIIKGCIETPGIVINLRLIERLVSFVCYDMNKAKSLFLSSIEVDESLQIIYDIIKHTQPQNQCKEYMRVTGHSKMTFFRKKKQLKILGLI